LPRNKYPEETVQTILDAALKLFLKKGYEDTTILDIVDEMGGLTRGAFYHHFKSKEEVLLALTSKMFYDNNLFEHAKEEKGLTGLEKIKFMLVESFEESNSNYRKISMEVLKLLTSPRFLKSLIDDNRDIVAPMYQEIIEEGMRDGSIKTENPKLLAELFTILTNFWMIPTIFPCNEKESWERFLFIKELTDKMGLPVFDEEILELCRKSMGQ